MTDKILKRLVDIAKHRRDVEIDTIAQISIYTGNELDYYRIYDRDFGVIYIIEESEMVFDLSKFNVCEKLVLADLGTCFADYTMELEYCKSEDGKKIKENVYSTFDKLLGIKKNKLELFKFKELRYNPEKRWVTLYNKDENVVGYVNPDWVRDR
ncbi:hypothetical protein [Peptacetobacter sp.]|uniref:hypothetical protein n=1 Tax=Peptacetobacter sp. TaxID=2991975 RepID=UPI003AB3CA2F